MRVIGKRRVLRGLGGLVGVLVGVSLLGACPVVTGILDRPEAPPESFEARLLEISDLLQGMFYDTGYDRQAARVNSEKAMAMWMELYLRYYLTPPENFRDHPRWREVMDSVTGPLRRIQRYAQEEAFFRGHHQLRVLQDCMTEFYGPPPPRRAASLGPVFHTLETLQYIPGENPEEARERRARLRLLRDRYDDWLARWPDQEKASRRFQGFTRELEGLELAVAGEKTEEIPRLVQRLLAATRPMIRQALALEFDPRAEVRP